MTDDATPSYVTQCVECGFALRTRYKITNARCLTHLFSPKPLPSTFTRANLEHGLALVRDALDALETEPGPAPRHWATIEVFLLGPERRDRLRDHLLVMQDQIARLLELASE